MEGLKGKISRFPELS